MGIKHFGRSVLLQKSLDKGLRSGVYPGFHTLSGTYKKRGLPGRARVRLWWQWEDIIY